MINFFNLNYLLNGNERQKKAYRLLQETQAMRILDYFCPVLVGTIPIEVDIASSDLDILCEVKDRSFFRELMIKEFGHYSCFQYVEKTNYTISRFTYERMSFEIFGQNVPTKNQNGYRHMIVEHRLLQLFDPLLRQLVIEQKQAGLKTEVAFAKVLHIVGDPYVELLKLYYKADEELWSMFFYPKKGEGIMIFDNVKLAQPAQRALHNAGFTHLNQLTKITKNEVAKLHGIGPKALEQLDKVLTKKGLTFAKEK